MRDELEAILGKLDLNGLSPKERKLLGDLPNYVDLVERDGLTGVYNRRKFNDDLKAAIGTTERTERDTSLLMIDVDHFKSVNDKYGHPKGDEVLQNVAMAISESLRGNERNNLYRYGGEEFAVIIPDTNTEEGVIVAERLREAVKKSCGLEDREITVSVGVSNYRGACRNSSEIVDSADQALYGAKEAGRDRVVVYGRGTKAKQMEFDF